MPWTDLLSHSSVASAQRWWAKASGFAEQARRIADDAATATLGKDFEQRSRRIREHYQALGDDPFGLDPDLVMRAAAATVLFHRRYFRTEVHGIERVPAGRALLIANHSGQLPIDAVIVCLSMFLDADPPRLVRSMVEKWAQTLPFVAPMFSRLGHVVGVPDNCRRLLDRGELILAFPEGVRGISKPYTKRYQLEEFGTGFMRLALSTSSPVVPVAIIGAEEQYVSVGNLEWAAKALGLPALPIVPQLALPGGLLPLPTKYRLYFGDPLEVKGEPDDEDRVRSQVWLVKQTISSLLQQGLQQRKSIFF
jgi:1-acyl-sn-glycerol-3-phosphate acyltransferase